MSGLSDNEVEVKDREMDPKPSYVSTDNHKTVRH